MAKTVDRTITNLEGVLTGLNIDEARDLLGTINTLFRLEMCGEDLKGDGHPMLR